jgi:hypothetical protein
VLKVRGKGDKIVLIPLPPAIASAIDRAVDDRDARPLPATSTARGMDRHVGHVADQGAELPSSGRSQERVHDLGRTDKFRVDPWSISLDGPKE